MSVSDARPVVLMQEEKVRRVIREVMAESSAGVELLEQIANRLERIDVTLGNLNAKIPAPQHANADQVTFARLHAEYDIEVDRISRAIPFGYKVEWYIHNASLRFLLRTRAMRLQASSMTSAIRLTGLRASTAR